MGAINNRVALLLEFREANLRIIAINWITARTYIVFLKPTRSINGSKTAQPTSFPVQLTIPSVSINTHKYQHAGVTRVHDALSGS